jgi:hypothetical protein
MQFPTSDMQFFFGFFVKYYSVIEAYEPKIKNAFPTLPFVSLFIVINDSP